MLIVRKIFLILCVFNVVGNPFTVLTIVPGLSCQVLFKDGVFQWKRLENLITLAKENVTKMSSNPALQGNNTSVSFHFLVAWFVYIFLDWWNLIISPCNLMSFVLCLIFRRQRSRALQVARKLDLTDTIKDGARLFLVDEGIRRKLLLALTEDSKLHVQEVRDDSKEFIFIRLLKRNKVYMYSL